MGEVQGIVEAHTCSSGGISKMCLLRKGQMRVYCDLLLEQPPHHLGIAYLLVHQCHQMVVSQE